MKKNPAFQAGLFNLRVLTAVALCSVGTMLGLFSVASTPPSGTLTDVSGPLNYTAGPFFVANKTPIPEWDTGPECDNPFEPCDDYALTVTLEILGQEIPIYEPLRTAVIELEAQADAEVEAEAEVEIEE